MTTADLLDRTRLGFQNIALSSNIKKSALCHLEQWYENRNFIGLMDKKKDDYLPLLLWMVTQGHFNLLLDSFYQVIPFGTGGRRGPVGIGPNRINPYTVASSVQGHVEYLHNLLPTEKHFKVVIAYDVREYHDLRNIYPKDIPNPLLGLSSKNLAHIAASVYCGAGIQVYMLPDQQNKHISTPELSFFIRFFEAHGGLNISASHNHPDDNGAKFYNSCGGQEIPPNDEHMIQIVEKTSDIRSMPYKEALQSTLIKPVTEKHRRAYIDLNLGLRLRSTPGPAKIVFTPLHGTGTNTVGHCLQEVGFKNGKQFFTVKEQLECRGDFVNVKFRSPNPEVPESLELALTLANQVGADLVLATDPDADRIGAAARQNNEMIVLTGNELASILTRYRLESLQHNLKMPDCPIVLKTEVTTELVSKIASSLGAQVIGDLLVGFKYMSDILHQLEWNGHFRFIEASPKDLVIATEESHGFLLTPYIRDKDATGAALILADLASELKEQGKTIHSYLRDTYKRFGYYSNLLHSTVIQGATGTTTIKTIQDKIRIDPPREIEGRKLVSCRDFWDETVFGEFRSKTDRNARNLITLTFEGGIRVSIRPSGTEPKNKVYIEKGTEPMGLKLSEEKFSEMCNQVDQEVEKFSTAFMQLMFSLINIEVPTYVLKISDLVSLDNKCHFARSFIPAFEDKTRAFQTGHIDKENLNRWIDKELKNYGLDARQLVAPAVRSYLDSSTCNDPSVTSIRETQREIFFGSN